MEKLDDEIQSVHDEKRWSISSRARCGFFDDIVRSQSVDCHREEEAPMNILKVVIGLILFVVLLEAASLSRGVQGNMVDQIKRDLRLG